MALLFYMIIVINWDLLWRGGGGGTSSSLQPVKSLASQHSEPPPPQYSKPSYAYEVHPVKLVCAFTNATWYVQTYEKIYEEVLGEKGPSCFRLMQ